MNLRRNVCRDVKPENIVLEGGKAGGRVFLVDFGGVQAAALDQDFGSTIVGKKLVLYIQCLLVSLTFFAHASLVPAANPFQDTKPPNYTAAYSSTKTTRCCFLFTAWLCWWVSVSHRVLLITKHRF